MLIATFPSHGYVFHIFVVIIILKQFKICFPQRQYCTILELGVITYTFMGVNLSQFTYMPVL